MNITNYEYIWRKSLIHVTDEFTLPPVVLQAGEVIIGTLGGTSVYRQVRQKPRRLSM